MKIMSFGEANLLVLSNISVRGHDFIRVDVCGDKFIGFNAYVHTRPDAYIERFCPKENVISNTRHKVFEIKNKIVEFYNIVRKEYHSNNLSLYETYGIISTKNLYYLIHNEDKFNLFLLKYSEYI